LAEAVREANTRVFLTAQHHPSLRGMGTTLTAALVTPQQAWVAHVGDSRLYRVRNASLEPQTEDDSLVASMVRQGHLTVGQAEHHPFRHVLTQAIGTQPEVKPHLYRVPLAPKDQLMLCSDGLLQPLEEWEILNVLLTTPDLAEATDLLIRLANERGGPDNITVILVRVQEANGS
jgi:protein phosphatase